MATLQPQLAFESQLSTQDSPPKTSAVDARKLRGGFYTPSRVAAFLAEWAIRNKESTCLEPSAGDGEFVAAAARCLQGMGETIAVEADPYEAEKIVLRGHQSVDVVCGDFFSWFRSKRPQHSFDVVLGNPPFIRYHDFPEEHRQPAFELMREEGLHPTRLTNAWLPFVVAATMALRTGGRLALVLPAELLQVMYAAELREYLARKYTQLTIVTFRRLVFPGIQEEIVLLLGIRGEECPAQISFVELEAVEELKVSQIEMAETVRVDLDHAREKWIRYYLSPVELGLIREIEKTEVLGRFGDLAKVDVGTVTGRNEFFVLTRAQAEEYGVREWCLPLVGRSAQIPGIVLRTQEWERLVTNGGKCFLMQLGNRGRDELSNSALEYIKSGERLGFHQGYKCRVRLPRWWNVPSVWAPDAFLLRQIHDGPRVVQNLARATCTDTIHRVRTVGSISSAWLASAFVNSATFAFSEIKGRSYGGGVLELEPSEAEELPFPKPRNEVESLPVDELDNLIRCKGVESGLIEVDRLVLKTAGFSNSDLAILRGIWRKLYERRQRRKRGSAACGGSPL